MSILRYFNKHQGWYDGKRTPFGDGGGSWSPADPFRGAGDALASIDPGPAIGQGLAELDKSVGETVPGGWKTLAQIAAAIATYGATLPESEAAFMAADAANMANNGYNAATIAQNLEAGYSLTAAQAAAAAAAAAEGFAANGPIATQALPYSETFDAYNLAQQGLSSSAIEQNLAATGLDKFLAADMAQMAASGLSPEAIAQNLAYSYSPTELAGTGIESMQAKAGMSATDVLKNVNRARQIAGLLNQGGNVAKNLSIKNIPTAQQWQQQAQQNFMTAPQEQFGGLYQMNKNPFTFQNPLASALANKPATGLDVSGTSGQALNTQNQNQIYSSLLRS